MNGTIALDIDGTITADSRQHTMPPRVVRYLTKLAQDGRQPFFITGRAFASGLTIDCLTRIPHVIAGSIGVSFSHPKAHALIREWYRLTALVHPAMTLYPEEYLLSVAAWRTNNPPTAWVWDLFNVRSFVPIKPTQSDKPFWFDKG